MEIVIIYWQFDVTSSMTTIGPWTTIGVPPLFFVQMFTQRDIQGMNV